MISTVERVLFLKSAELFAEIPGEDLAQVAQIAEELDFEAGAYLMEEGQLGDGMLLIIDGRVSVQKGEKEITQLGPKECVGELSILDAQPRSASVFALNPVRALRISREDFYELMVEKRGIAQGIIKVLSRRLRASTGLAVAFCCMLVPYWAA